jgi:calcium/calmodulin-dependent protein kinase I
MQAEHQSDYVRDSKLATTFTSTETRHVHYTSSRRTRRRRERREETWRWEKVLGEGAFGKVWLETCVAGDSSGKLRAVKEVKKEFEGVAVDYTRELEAAAKFSHQNVSSSTTESKRASMGLSDSQLACE